MRQPRGLRRWVAFNAVGTAGLGVQLLALAAAAELLRLDYRAATALAVEAAILHNFFWHERWTWRDRRGGRRGRWLRLVRFNAVSGSVAIAANVGFTALYATLFGIHYLFANIMAVATCSFVNFLAHDRLVFRARNDRPASALVGCARRKENRTMEARSERSAVKSPLPRVALVLGLVAGGAAGLAAAELKEETVAAWQRYVEATERRIAGEIADGDRFLVLDFLPGAQQTRQELLAGALITGRMEAREENGQRIKVPKGEIHHWRGAILVPNADVDHVVDGLQFSVPPHELQNDVLESRVLWRDGNRLGTFLKVSRKSVVTMHYNTEHVAEYVRPGGGRAWSHSASTRIAELENAGSPAEREKPVGNDRGFLWRLNVYWRYEEVAAGVLMECEIVTLSRSIPVLMRWIIGPIVNRETRATVVDMLQSMRVKLDPGPPADRE